MTRHQFVTLYWGLITDGGLRVTLAELGAMTDEQRADLAGWLVAVRMAARRARRGLERVDFPPDPEWLPARMRSAERKP